jgi:CheY-like chemotaxis protein
MIENNRILVIEDNEDILFLFKTILADKNFQVLAKDNADDIELVTNEFSPGVILMDMLLSGQNGLQVCKILKGNPSTRNIPIVIVSAHPAVAKSFEAGAEFFIAKPFEIADLLDTISKAIDLEKQRRT